MISLRETPLGAAAGDRGAFRLAAWYPDSMLFEPCLTRQDILELNAGQAMSDALAASQSQERIGSIFRSVPARVKEFIAVRSHEHDHLIRNLNTTFGIFSQWLRAMTLQSALRMFDLVADQRKRGPILPLLPQYLCDELGTTGPTSAETVSAALDIWG